MIARAFTRFVHPRRVISEYLWPSSVSVGMAVGLMAAWLGRSELGLSTFVVAGALHADADSVPRELQLNPDTVGYDGQYFYRLTLDPFTEEATDFGIPLDNPAYRQRRILYPLLAHVLLRTTGISALLWLALINLVAVGAITALVVHICRRFGRSPWWAILVGLSPPMYIGVTRDLSEPMALTLAVAGVVCVLHGKWPWAAFLFTLAALTRETTLVFPAGLGIWALTRGLAKRDTGTLLVAAHMLLPLGFSLLWESWLRQNWDSAALSDAIGRQLGFPWWQTLKGLYSPGTEIILEASELSQWLWRIERFMLAALFIATLVIVRRSLIHPGLRVSFVLAVLLAGAPAIGWAWDAQFIRAGSEAIVLMQLILIATPEVRARITLELTGLLGLMVVGSS